MTQVLGREPVRADGRVNHPTLAERVRTMREERADATETNRISATIGTMLRDLGNQLRPARVVPPLDPTSISEP